MECGANCRIAFWVFCYWFRKAKRLRVDTFVNADDEYSFALLGNSVLNRVDEFVAHGIANVSEGLDYHLESVSVLMCG